MNNVITHRGIEIIITGERYYTLGAFYRTESYARNKIDRYLDNDECSDSVV